MDQREFRSPNINEPMSDHRFDAMNRPDNVVQPNQPVVQPSRPDAMPPVPNSLRRDHNMPFGEQHSVELSGLPVASQGMFQSPSGRPQMPQQLNGVPGPQPPVPNQPAQPNQPYDFIFNPAQQAPKQKSLPSLPGLGPRLGRVALITVGLIVLLIIFSIIKSSLGGSGNLPALESVGQDETEILHITSEASQQQNLTASDQDLIATTSLVLTSSDRSLITYLKDNGHKVNAKIFQLKISSTVDSQLASAATAGTYDQVFDQVINDQLSQYQKDLNTAYNLTKGLKGRALLSSDYKQSTLLRQQLN
jgi:hypothetical protein